MGETRRIDYAPDYKSENKEDAFLPESVAKVIRARLDAEEAATSRVQLERKVIEAARKWRHDKTFNSDTALFNAVCELEKFESKQEK